MIDQVVDMLVYFEPGAMCHLQSDLILASLPARKQLWEAIDEFKWRLESDKRLQTDFALVANGELVDIDADQIHCGDTLLLYKTIDPTSPLGSPASWTEWCSGMDNLGNLIMLVASLLV